MQVQDRYMSAATIVFDWADLPEESYSEAISAQAGYLAGTDADDVADFALDVTVH